MSKNNDKTKASKWYDGFLYDKFITPFESEIMRLVDEFIPDDSTVIDIGCGPGTLALMLSSRCKKVVGVDISKKMIKYANRQKKKAGSDNISFICEDASTMAPIQEEKFSCAALSMCLHGMPGNTRQDVMKNCITFAEKVIIADFLSPWPRNIRGAGQIILEKIEGEESFENFNDWLLNGGIDGFIKKMGLNLVEEKCWSTGFGKTIFVSK